MAFKLNRKGVGLSGANLDKENQNLTLIEQEFNKLGQVKLDFDRVIAEAGSNNPEVVHARGNEVNLNARLDKTAADLATKVGGTKKAKMEDFDDEVISAMTGGATVNVLSIPQEGSVTPSKTTFMKSSKNLFKGVYSSGVMAFAGAVLGGPPDRLRFRSNVAETDNGKVAVIPIEANETYNVKVHEPEKKTYFKVAVHNSEPVFGSFQDANTLILNDDTKSEVTFTNTAEGRYLMVYVSLTGQEPKMQVEAGTVATPYQSGMIIGAEYVNIADLQISHLSTTAQAELKKQALIEQARITESPVVNLSLNRSLKDKVSGDAAIYLGPAKTHPFTGEAVSANVPAYVGLSPNTKGGTPYKLIDSHASRQIGWAVNGNRIFGIDGNSLVYSDDFGTTIVTGHAFPSKVNGVWVSARGSIFVGTTDGTTESDASLAKAKLYRSTDNGITFTQVLGLLAGEVRNNCFSSLGDTIFISEYGGRALPNNSSHIYKSTDDGITFTQVGDLDTGAPLHIHFVRINPFNANHIYAGTGDVDASCGVWRSVDGGTTWAVVNGLIGNQDYRVTDVVFEPNVAYFGGDGFVDREGYNRPGERFGLYKLDLTNDSWTKMQDIQGPVYSMIKDAQGNIWAAVMASADVSKPQNVDKADWTSLLILSQGVWKEVVRIRGLGISGGILQLSSHPQKGIFAVTSKISVAPLFGSLLFSQDSPYNSGIYMNTGDSLTFNLPAALPPRFTAALKVKATFDWSSIATAEERTIFSFGTGTDRYYNIFFIKQAVGTQRFYARKATSSSAFVTAATSNLDVKKNDVLTIAIRENNGELWIFIYNSRSRQFVNAKVTSAYTIPSNTLKIATAFGTQKAFGNIAADFELREYAMSDGELMRLLTSMAEN